MNYPRSNSIPEPTLRRLPGYFRHFQELQKRGVASVSCRVVGRDLNLDPTLVRKDLESIAMVGRRGVGFSIPELVNGIGAFLGYGGTNHAVLAGAGSLGTALLGYKKFRQYGLEIVAAFDVAPARVGTRLYGIEVLPLSSLSEAVQQRDVQLGIITVPADAAQQVADMMVEGGVKAIWNFAPTRLRVPQHVIVQNEDLYNSLATLSHRLNRAQAHAAAASSICEPSLAGPVCRQAVEGQPSI